MIAVSFDFDGVLARSPFAYGVLFPVLQSLAEEYSRESGMTIEDSEEQLKTLLWAAFRWTSWRRHESSLLVAC